MTHKNQSIKLLPTIFNLQKYYHSISFICAGALLQSKKLKKGQQKGRHFKKRRLFFAGLPSLLVYALHLYLPGSAEAPEPGPGVLSTCISLAVRRLLSSSLVFLYLYLPGSVEAPKPRSGVLLPVSPWQCRGS